MQKLGHDARQLEVHDHTKARVRHTWNDACSSRARPGLAIRVWSGKDVHNDGIERVIE